MKINLENQLAIFPLQSAIVAAIKELQAQFKTCDGISSGDARQTDVAKAQI